MLELYWGGCLSYLERGLTAGEGTSLRWPPRGRLAGRREHVEECWNASACGGQEFAGLEVSSTGQLATSAPCEVIATFSQPRTYVIP